MSNATSDAAAGNVPPMRTGRWLMLTCAGLIALAVGAAVLAIWSARREALARYQQTETNLGFVLAEETARSIQGVDLVVQAIRAQVLASGVTTPAEFAAALNQPATGQALRDRLRNLPQAAAIHIVSADGRVVASSVRLPETTVDVSDREFFGWFREHPADIPFISPPVQGRLTPGWTAYVVRRVAGPDGTTLGFVAGGLALSYFEQFYHAIAHDDATAITLMRRGGTILARYPGFDQYVGTHLPPRSQWFAVARQGGGLYRSGGELTGHPRWVSVHPLQDYSLAVDVSFSEAAAVRDWQRQSVAIACTAVAVVAVLLLLFRALVTQVRRLGFSEAALAQRNAEQEVARLRLESQAEALRHSEADAEEKSAALQTTLESMDQGIMMVNADRVVEVCNARAMQMLDLPAELMNRRPHFADVVAHQWRVQEFSVTPEKIQQFIRAGGILDQAHVYERRRPNGTVLEIRSMPLPGGGVVRTYSDVTERKAAEEQVTAAGAQAEAARAAAEQANRAKTEFLANISHEIRTPMNGIIGMNELLLRSTMTDKQRDCALTVRDSAAALLRVIDDVLDISKLEAGRMELDPVDFDLGETIAATVALLAPRAEEKGIALTTQIEPAARRRFHADAIRLRQILLNLLGNATKFTEHGSVTVAVRLLPAASSPTGSPVPEGAAPEGAVPEGAADPGLDRAPDRVGAQRVAIEVADTGIGMNEATQARLFQKFTQADSSISRRFGGTGLGLAITRELLGLMGGTISVTSQLGKGSRFLVTLPLLPPVGDAPAGGPRAVGQGGAGGPALVVLVADDNRTNQRLVAALLQAAGHMADVVANGREAVEAVLRRHYDVVLMDVQMPVMDGVQATRRIRALPAPARDVPIVALTADAVTGAEDRYRGAGMDAYLSKPLSPDTLVATLDALVRGGPRPEAKQPAGPPVGPPVDRSAISGLRGFMDGTEFAAFIADSVRDLAVRIDGLGDRIAAGELEHVVREAHDLVAVAGNCGACKVSTLARSVEQAARRGDAAEARRLFADIPGAGGQAAEALEELLGA